MSDELLPKNLLARQLDVLALLISGVVSFLFFARAPVRLEDPGFQSEFLNHANLLPLLEQAEVTAYSLWYWSQIALLGESREPNSLVNAALLLIGGLAFMKGIVFSGTLLAFSSSRIWAVLVGSLLGFAVALPTLGFTRWSPALNGSANYLGTIPPNVFMSATQLVANIFAVISVVALCTWFVAPRVSSLVVMTVLSVAASLAKPGFALPWVLVLPILITYLIWKHQITSRQGFLSGLVGLTPAGMIIFFTYQQYMSGSGWAGMSSTLMPLRVWSSFTNQWLIDLLASWAFPISVIAVLIVSRRLARSESRSEGVNPSTSHLGMRTRLSFEFLFPAWLFAIGALLPFILLAEVDSAGTLVVAGNFIWGAISATAGLYLVSGAYISNWTWKQKAFPVAVLAVQAFAGIQYVNNYLSSGSYL